MIRNNLRALAAHLTISIFSFAIYFLTHIATGLVKKASQEAYIDISDRMIYVSLILMFFALIGYSYIGSKFLKSVGGIGKNMSSVSVTFYAGLLLWCISAFFGGHTGFAMNTAYGSWQWYLIFNAYCLPLVNDFNITNGAVLLMFSILPALIMGLSMKIGRLNLKGRLWWK